MQILNYILLIIGREPPGDVGAVELADDDGGGLVQPAQGEPGRLPRHLQPRVQRRLCLSFPNIEAPSCRTYQQVVYDLILELLSLCFNMEQIGALHILIYKFQSQK